MGLHFHSGFAEVEAGPVHDGANHELEVERIRSELADEFDDVSPQLIEHGVRAEFDRRSSYPVQDFVAIFVERSVRGRLRADYH
jgi:hypothetical protein